MASEARLHRLGAVVWVDQPQVGLAGRPGLEAGLLATITPTGAGFKEAFAYQMLSLIIGRAMPEGTSRTVWEGTLGSQDSSRSVGDLDCSL